MLEAQLAKGTRRIDEQTIDRFGDMLRETMRGDDSSLRSSYLKMFVSAVSVSDHEVVISGPVSSLENGVSVGLPVKEGAVPNLDRELTGLEPVDAGRRKAELLAGALIRGPRVAHTKFGPFFGIEPAPIGTPCVAFESNGSGDSVCLHHSVVRLPANSESGQLAY